MPEKLVTTGEGLLALAGAITAAAGALGSGVWWKRRRKAVADSCDDCPVKSEMAEVKEQLAALDKKLDQQWKSLSQTREAVARIEGALSRDRV